MLTAAEWCHAAEAPKSSKPVPKTLAGVSNQHVEELLERRNKKRKQNGAVTLPAVSSPPVHLHRSGGRMLTQRCVQGFGGPRTAAQVADCGALAAARETEEAEDPAADRAEDAEDWEDAAEEDLADLPGGVEVEGFDIDEDPGVHHPCLQRRPARSPARMALRPL